jgi:hypothetical protein
MTDFTSIYRSILNDNSKDNKENEQRMQEKENRLWEKYSQHIDVYGGLFTPELRMKLFRKNKQNNLEYIDKSRDWVDIRKSVKNGLIDIQMLCEIASFEQIKKMFEHVPDHLKQETSGLEKNHLDQGVSPNLIFAINSILSVDLKKDPKYYVTIEKLEKQRREIDKTKVIPLEDERRKFVLERKELEKKLAKYKDNKKSMRIIIIENEIKSIDKKIREFRKTLEEIDAKILHNDPKLELWKAKLAKQLISQCLYFLIKNHFVYSEDRKEYLDKVNLIIDSELSRFS